MIREMLRTLKGRRTLEHGSRRRRRFQPGLGLSVDGLETRLAPSGFGMESAPAPAPADQQGAAGDGDGSTTVTVSNQDEGGAPTSTNDDDNRAGQGD